MDFNDYLRNTKTAAEVDKNAVKVFLAGHKRGASSKETVAAPANAEAGVKQARRSGAVEGLNLQAAQDALAQERGSTSAQAQQQHLQADLLSEQAAVRMVHRVLDYVLQTELGGRHNASKGGVAPFVPTAAQLAAERAMWTPAAGYTIHHVVPASSDAGTSSSTSTNAVPTLETLVSVTEKERVPEGIRILRNSLQVCDVACDLVGGVRSGMAPHLRAHVLEVLERGLRGEAWLRDDAATTATFLHALGKPTSPEKGPSTVLLFCDSSTGKSEHVMQTGEESGRNDASSVAAPAAATGANAGGFSLAAFLNKNNSSTSSDDDDGN